MTPSPIQPARLAIIMSHEGEIQKFFFEQEEGGDHVFTNARNFMDLVPVSSRADADIFLKTIREQGAVFNRGMVLAWRGALTPLYLSGIELTIETRIIATDKPESTAAVMERLIALRQFHDLTLLSISEREWPGCSVDNSELMSLQRELGRKNAALENTNEQLKNINQELKAFVYNVSHDLREPIRSVYGFLELLKKKYKDQLNEDASEFIQYALEGARRANQMIIDLANYSRLGQPSGVSEIINTNVLLEAVVKNLAYSIQENWATVTWNNLPQVKGYPAELIRLFQNLIENSIKFCDKAKKPHIEINAQAEGAFYKFSIKDNGIGIPEQSWETIFQVFRRVHHHEGFEGSGIGLAICKKIVEWHGGRIWVRSAPGEGSTFFFTLKSDKYES